MKVLALSLAILLAAYSLCSQTSVGPPSDSLDGLNKRGVTFKTTYAGLEGSLSYDMLEKRIHLRWYRDFPDGTHSRSSQDEGLTYWPTEICAFGPDKVCIAGKDSKGKTVIRVWEFSTADALEDPHIDPGTGERVYPPTHIPVGSTTTLYEADVPGKRLVRTMFKNHGAPNSLLVQFEDSRDFYRLDAATGTLTMALSATVEPRLHHAFHDRWDMNDVNRGYLYMLCQTRGENGMPESLILIDTARTGNLNPSATLDLFTEDEWVAAFPDQEVLQPVY